VSFLHSMRSSSVAIGVSAALTAVLVSGCAQEPLPEEGTPVAQLYVQRCGTCHRAYRPGLLTVKMWDAMMSRMELEMKRRGIRMTADERNQIQAYLERNAGTR
jgi:hypothetical protein